MPAPQPPRCLPRLVCLFLLPALVWLLDVPGAPTVESFVYVGPDGLPRFEPDAAERDIPIVANEEQLPLAERLALLAEVSLLVRVQCGTECLVVQLRPDLLWLAILLPVNLFWAWLNAEEDDDRPRHMER